MLANPYQHCPDWDADAGRGTESAKRAEAKALVYARKEGKRRTPTVIDVRQTHENLFSWCTPAHHPYYAGGFRDARSSHLCLRVDVGVRSETGDIYPCASAVKVPELMAALIASIAASASDLDGDEDHIEEEVWAERFSGIVARLIGDFIRIHPFRNGNGRTSRMLWAWMVMRAGFPPQVTVTNRPEEPYTEYMASCMVGDDGPLRIFILGEIQKAAQALLQVAGPVAPNPANQTP